jgi:hypothetical protein
MGLRCLLCGGAGETGAALPLNRFGVPTLFAVKREERRPRGSDSGDGADQPHALSAEGARQGRVTAHGSRDKQGVLRGTSGKLRRARFPSAMQLRHTTDLSASDGLPRKSVSATAGIHRGDRWRGGIGAKGTWRRTDTPCRRTYELRGD